MNQRMNCSNNYGRMHCACAKQPYFHFRSKIWRHHCVHRLRFPKGRENFADSAINNILPFWGFYVSANLGENRSRNATVRVLADGQTDTLTDANRFYNLSHAKKLKIFLTSMISRRLCKEGAFVCSPPTLCSSASSCSVCFSTLIPGFSGSHMAPSSGWLTYYLDSVISSDTGLSFTNPAADRRARWTVATKERTRD